ncbi:CHASE2 domain-containing protein [Rhodoferax fermentans]|uniref:Adenylate/guanylate cyclase domain-containing protein n=1 Tax=Rhodoferax fermentans TaxID=28066 RepID=A0A1T1AWG4_RHOFE|nr:adenylate/guanylate cyclase domain-containing protein [Rhodoferax fermentans]OOV08343.1 adenylate/guanylate cyclase domain-containing protein [Rhodoferax fermentans]
MSGWTHTHRWSMRWLVPVGVVAVWVLVMLLDPLPLQMARNGLFDQLQRWQPRPYSPAPVRIIDIDDESLKRLGQWPWPRTRIAELTTRLQAAQPASIVFDVLFAEPDRTSPKAMLKLWPATPALRQQLQALPDHDAVFARAVASGPVVLGFAVERREQPGVLPGLKARYVATGEPAQPYVPAFSGAINPLPELAAAASGLGAIAFLPDADGVVRRVPLLLRVGDTLVPSLTAEALRVAQGAKNFSTQTVAQAGVGLAELRIGRQTVPTTPQGEVWVHYSEPVAQRSIPAWRVWAGEVSASELAGHILLVGSSAQGLLDLRFSPLGVVVPGVEVHAQALEQLLTGGGLVYPAWAQTLALLLALLGGLLGGLLVGFIALSYGAALSLTALATLLLALGALVAYAFSHQGVLIDAVAPGMTVVFSYVFSSVVHHVQSEQRQRWIRQAFSRYVSPNLVTYLIKQPGALELGGRRQDCSFVFTDLTGFTSWLEQMDPQQAVRLLNDYLDGMIAIAFQHEATLDRIVGDALVLMFSAPVLQTDHPRRALNCAWEMHRFSTAYVARLAAQNVPFGLTRIGVHSGEVIVGNVGGKTLFDYRALGDPINTAARLESANKQFGTLVCVSKAILRCCPEWPARPIGQVLLQGKTQPIEVFEPLAPEQAGDVAYAQAFELMRQQSPQALQVFSELATRRPTDPLVALHLGRLRAGQVGDLLVLSSK